MVEVELKEQGNSMGLRKGDKIEIKIIAKKRVDGFGISKGAMHFKEDNEEHIDFW